MREEWCTCSVFTLWYAEDDVRVCTCGHPDEQHVYGTRMCIGDVTVDRGVSNE